MEGEAVTPDETEGRRLYRRLAEAEGRLSFWRDRRVRLAE